MSNGSRGIVLSGGGARGAYEAGVMLALIERTPHGGTLAEIISGTSVGAVTGAFLAGAGDDLAAAAARLEELWSTVALEDVLSFGAGQIASLPRLLRGGYAQPVGLFDARKLAAAVDAGVRWERIGERIAAGRLHALTVTATHIPTGRPTVFVQRRPELPPIEHAGRRVVVRAAQIGLPHVLASAAIPVLFPAVAVDGDLYCDGGLRLNTPLGPAIRLGARKVLVTGLPQGRDEPELPQGRYPGVAFLLGKVLDAFLLDHLAGDLDELHRINRFLANGAAVYGPDFVEQLSERARAEGEPRYVPVQPFVVRPSADLGAVAAGHLRRMRRRFGRISAARWLLRLMDPSDAQASDLASYLLFDKEYTRELLELGRSDGRAARDALDGFLAP